MCVHLESSSTLNKLSPIGPDWVNKILSWRPALSTILKRCQDAIHYLVLLSRVLSIKPPRRLLATQCDVSWVELPSANSVQEGFGPLVEVSLKDVHVLAVASNAFIMLPNRCGAVSHLVQNMRYVLIRIKIFLHPTIDFIPLRAGGGLARLNQ